MMLERKITEKTAKIGVVGLGYVGLPLALLCAQKGFGVIGIENNQAKVIGLQHGESYLTGISADILQACLAERKFCVMGNYAQVRRCDVLIICVATPLTDDGKPDYAQLFLALEGVAARLRPQQLIIIESTIIPGTTQEIILPRLEAGGLKVGRDFYLVFSPERIDPANQQYSMENTPKLVAGVTDACLRMGRSFYDALRINIIPVSAPHIAEMAKLLENTYRDVNIALLNEMAEVCSDLDIDIWEVIEAAATKPFGFQPFYPGIGVGGHCIPKDSAYYLYLARQKGRPAHLVELARKINAERPLVIAERIKESLVKQDQALSGCPLLFLGVTYKKDVDDLRESPAVKLMELLADEGAKIAYHDPYIKKLRVGKQVLVSMELTVETVSQYPWCILAVPHSCYDLAWLQAICPGLVDLTNALRKEKYSQMK